MKTIDLDLLAPEPVSVVLTVAGERVTLTVPGDVPVPVVVRLLQLQSSLGENEQAIPEAYDVVMSALCAVNPDLPADCPLGLRALGQLIGLLLGGEPDQDAENIVLEAVTGDAENGEVAGDGAPLEAEAPGSRSAKRSPRRSQRSAA